jgi:hypothetical protein
MHKVSTYFPVSGWHIIQLSDNTPCEQNSIDKQSISRKTHHDNALLASTCVAGRLRSPGSRSRPANHISNLYERARACACVRVVRVCMSVCTRATKRNEGSTFIGRVGWGRLIVLRLLSLPHQSNYPLSWR